MAYVVNLYGNNTHGLAAVAGGLLRQMGYTCLTVPSVRLNDQLTRMRDGRPSDDLTLEECEKISEKQAVRRDAALGANPDIVFNCGAGSDPFRNYGGNRDDLGYKVAVETAVENSRGDIDILPTQGMKKSEISSWRDFLRNSDIAPKIKPGCEFGCEDIVSIVTEALSKQKDVQRVTQARDSLVSGFKAPPISVAEAAKRGAGKSPIGQKLAQSAARAIKDGFGGIHLESIRGGRAASIAEQVATIAEASEDGAVTQVDVSRENKVSQNNMAAEKAADKSGKGPIMSNEKYTKIEFRDSDIRLGDIKSGRHEGEKKVNLTMPQGTVVNGQDISGFKTSRPAPDWLVKAKEDHQKSIKIGFVTDRDMYLYKYDKDGERSTLQLPVKDVAEAVGAAYEKLPVKDAVNAEKKAPSKYINIEFRDNEIRLGEFKSGRHEGEKKVNLTMPQGTVVNGQDISGFKTSRPAPDWLVNAKEDRAESIKIGFNKEYDMNLYKFDDDGKVENVKFPVKDVAEAVDGAYKEADAIAKPESLDEMASAKEAEAAGQKDQAPQPDLYDKDIEF